MIIHKFILLFLACVFSAGRIFAAEFSAETIINETLEHSYHIKMAGDQVAAAEAVNRQADAAVYPSVDLDGNAAHYEGVKENTLGPNVWIPAIPDRYSSGISLSQPVYTGGRIIGRKQMTDEQRLSSISSLAATRNDVIYQALVAYWSWSKAFYAAESFRAAVAWMEAHNRDMENMHKAGLVTENDRLSTSVRLDQTRLNLEEALRRTNLSRATIEKLTGKILPGDAVPSKPSADDMTPSAGEQELIRIALANRPDIKAQQAALNAARRNIKIQSASYFPQLNLKVRGEVARPNPLNIPPQDEWQFDAFAGVAASWNILDWGLTRAKVSEARARANHAGNQLSQLNEQAVFEVRQAVINLENAITRSRVAQRAEESATLDLKAATDLWKNGLARHSDVLDSQNRLTDASFDLVSARADVLLARAELEHAYGMPAQGTSEDE